MSYLIVCTLGEVYRTLAFSAAIDYTLGNVSVRGMPMDERYQKFIASKQEQLRLRIALEDFFREETDAVARDTYAQYLRRRLQPAAAALIAADDTVRLARLAEQGWFTAKQTDECIRLAAEEGKTAALVWLLRWKGRTYGFQDRDFSL